MDGNVYGVDHGVSLHIEDKLRTVLWGWAGKPIDDDTLEAVAGSAMRWRATWGRTVLPHHPTGSRRAAGQSRCPAEKSGDADRRPATADPVAGVLTWCTAR